MIKSEFTTNCIRKLWIFRVLDWLCIFTPLLVYTIIALSNNSIATFKRVCLIMTIVISLILVILNSITQRNLHCPIWIVLIGMYVAMKEYLLPLIIMLAVVSILDDLLFQPLIQYYKTKVIASKTMDERDQVNLSKDIKDEAINGTK